MDTQKLLQVGKVLLVGIIVTLFLYIVIGALFGVKTGTALTVFIIFAAIAVILNFAFKPFDVKHNTLYAIIVVIFTIFLLFILPSSVPSLYSLYSSVGLGTPHIETGTFSTFESVANSIIGWPVWIWVIVIIFLLALVWSKEKK